jgi:hypothetical protein
VKGGSQSALALLLKYNREDVVNLKVLMERLGSFWGLPLPAGARKTLHYGLEVS